MIEGLKKTNRGFLINVFKDANGVECSIQESSAIQDEGLVWLGATEIGLQRFEPHKGWSTVCLNEEWPENVSHIANNRMHLTQSQVSNLLPTLTYFAKHGVLPNKTNEGTS